MAQSKQGACSRWQNDLGPLPEQLPFTSVTFPDITGHLGEATEFIKLS